MCGLVILTFVATKVQTVLWLSSDWLVGTVLPAVVIDQTNNERVDLKEKPLRRNDLLDKAAQLKAEDMAKNHYFAHNSPRGVTPWHWFDVVSYQYSHAGENLAIHFTDSSAVVDAWMNSPAHRANIVNGSYTEIGVGTAEGEYEGFKTVFVVQLFGTPASAIQPMPKTPVLTESENKVTAVEVKSESVLVAERPETKPVVLSEETAIKPEASSDKPVVSKEEMVVLNSPETGLNLFAATSSGLLPASMVADSANYHASAGSTRTEQYATMPSLVLQIIYLVIGSIVTVLLLASVAISVKHHRPQQIAYGLVLLILMTGLFYLHTLFTAQIVIASST